MSRCFSLKNCIVSLTLLSFLVGDASICLEIRKFFNILSKLCYELRACLKLLEIVWKKKKNGRKGEAGSHR